MSDLEREPVAIFRVHYHRHDDVRTDVQQQLARGGLLVRVDDQEGVTLDDSVTLSLILPDGAELVTAGTVLQVLVGHGVAIGVPTSIVDDIRRQTAWKTDARDDLGPPEHSRVRPAMSAATASTASAVSAPDVPASATIPAAATHARPLAGIPRAMAIADGTLRLDELSLSEKIQMALHGSRDERNAILRDKNRTLHPFVLKNPQLSLDDVIAMAKNPQLAPDMLKQIGDRKEWLQRGSVALALAKNPRTPPDIAIRALDYVPNDALRAIAKGVGAMPHVVQAARKKVIAP